VNAKTRRNAKKREMKKMRGKMAEEQVGLGHVRIDFIHENVELSRR
jgi:hypothetical protein